MKDAFVPTSRPALGVFAVLSFAGVALAPDALTAGVAATAWYAPIHAWRASAQLRAVETVQLLLDMLDPMDAYDTDWHLEEFPDALAMIGPPALDAVADYLADGSHAEFARVCAADVLLHIAQQHPEMRQDAVASLSDRLREYEENTDIVNGFLICYLIDLAATESAELIERAYAAGQVDESIVGDRAEVRKELGVEGIGLVSERQARRDVRPRYIRVFDLPLSGEPGRSFKSRDREERKKRDAARKRNRRRRR